MAKVLIWIVVIIAVLFGLRLLNVAKGKRGVDPKGRESPPPTPSETMVRCARCGVYLPRADATPSPAGLTCGNPECAQPR
jgi:uncharacterized protein